MTKISNSQTPKNPNNPKSNFENRTKYQNDKGQMLNIGVENDII